VEKEYSKLFKKLPPALPPKGFLALVLARIVKEEQRVARQRLWFSAPMAFVSGFAVVFTFQYLAQDITQSGIAGYFSMLFSDGGTVLSYWREFSLSLAEQVPILSLTLFLGATLALLGSLSSVIKNMQTAPRYA
jgi:hypothetical protein